MQDVSYIRNKGVLLMPRSTIGTEAEITTRIKSDVEEILSKDILSSRRGGHILATFAELKIEQYTQLLDCLRCCKAVLLSGKVELNFKIKVLKLFIYLGPEANLAAKAINHLILSGFLFRLKYLDIIKLGIEKEFITTEDFTTGGKFEKYIDLDYVKTELKKLGKFVHFNLSVGPLVSKPILNSRIRSPKCAPIYDYSGEVITEKYLESSSDIPLPVDMFDMSDMSDMSDAGETFHFLDSEIIHGVTLAVLKV